MNPSKLQELQWEIERLNLELKKVTAERNQWMKLALDGEEVREDMKLKMLLAFKPR